MIARARAQPTHPVLICSSVSLRRPPYCLSVVRRPKREADIYVQVCASCHASWMRRTQRVRLPPNPPPSIPEPLELDTFPGIKQCAARRSSGARWREGFEGSTPIGDTVKNSQKKLPTIARPYIWTGIDAPCPGREYIQITVGPPRTVRCRCTRPEWAPSRVVVPAFRLATPQLRLVRARYPAP